jgi:lipoprotein NlpD
MASANAAMSALARRRPERATVAALLLLLAGCASDPAPVVEMSGGNAAVPQRPLPMAPATSTYRVVRGDTLYAIAFRHGLDYRDVAAWNRIEPPYRIFVGQDLRLSAQNGIGAPVASAAPASSTKPQPVVSDVHPSATPPSTTRGVVPGTAAGKPGMFEDVTSASEATPETPPPSATPHADPVRPAASATPPAAVVTQPPAVEAPAPPVSEPIRPAAAPQRVFDEGVAVSTGGVTWRWPGKGSLAATFVAGDQTRQGIDIAGKAGDPVLAAADGEVVYSGNGLLGYGELIIVKHNANFLSAYGHNRKRLVQEGDRVKSGQQIAEMGSTASSRDQLHFEIRKNGKPVNPLEYLPAH